MRQLKFKNKMTVLTVLSRYIYIGCMNKLFLSCILSWYLYSSAGGVGKGLTSVLLDEKSSSCGPIFARTVFVKDYKDHGKQFYRYRFETYRLNSCPFQRNTCQILIHVQLVYQWREWYRKGASHHFDTCR